MNTNQSHLQRFRTTDVEEAHDFFRTALVDLQVRFSKPGPEGALLDTRVAALDDLTVQRLHYSVGTLVQTEPSADLNINVMLDGHFVMEDRRDRFPVKAGGVVLQPPDRPLTVTFRGVDVLTVRLPRSLIEDAAREVGVDAAGLRFGDGRPNTDVLARHWSQTVAYVWQSLRSGSDVANNRLIVAHLRQLLARAALTTFSNATQDGDVNAGSRRVAPATLRRAMAYAEAHADRGVTVTDLAAEARLSVRALQNAFRRHRDTTPSQYLRQVRLDRAHRDLQAADPSTGATVAAIAARWNFTHAGRFSTDYRRAYGHSPGRTLHT
ncbi:AraC family transcriptional regulator [Micromonospora sp. LAH09]|uniref:helix-turn-helix transcriptional regulator n=1 Tax=Micromonospora cabrerizensis TaxID=2911213 RepID=UPI001EE7BAB8|nr:AraC family transcriptional regulator [Micromonospora cabrerizensis]MCG5469561.1 AraC family transcriptional regulator [Micromonospora cabrerizensis]